VTPSPNKSELISPAQAAAIFLGLTGKSRSPKMIASFDLPCFPHLAQWRYGLGSGNLRLSGVRRRQWEYFIRSRLALGYQVHEIFTPASLWDGAVGPDQDD
jgi:hypothetical protein